MESGSALPPQGACPSSGREATRGHLALRASGSSSRNRTLQEAGRTSRPPLYVHMDAFWVAH